MANPTTAATHLLRLVVSSRKFTAQVTPPTTNTIIAMASSAEQEFVAAQRAKLQGYPRALILWDSRTASRIGEKLAIRVKEIGLSTVRIDVGEEAARPAFHRKMMGPFFDSLKRGGITVDGAQDLHFIG